MASVAPLGVDHVNVAREAMLPIGRIRPQTHCANHAQRPPAQYGILGLDL
jgi:hypothetical protein